MMRIYKSQAKIGKRDKVQMAAMCGQGAGSSSALQWRCGYQPYLN